MFFVLWITDDDDYVYQVSKEYGHMLLSILVLTA